jgi:hypothetical protein
MSACFDFFILITASVLSWAFLRTRSASEMQTDEAVHRLTYFEIELAGCISARGPDHHRRGGPVISIQ